MKPDTTTLDLNDGTHSRFDESHYQNCDHCYEDHLDFMQEQEMDARMDEASDREEFGDSDF